jgi:hypothetical protein
MEVHDRRVFHWNENGVHRLQKAMNMKRMTDCTARGIFTHSTSPCCDLSLLLVHNVVSKFHLHTGANKAGYTLVKLPRTVTPYRDSVDGTRDHVTYQKLVTR